ncbi:quinolinate synthase [Halalkalibacillus sediminis]|uniref:Quinolinate synthase n=1 Tax=Halalkalibacillus sediminis TaxID=2018042 RepID=A0A2I0QYI5_9BACI|nr:quinolinate synthase NadA [Halalkalibacillus sediminis]PKR79391.1 quinolinate synthase [Halalkalibacillus sediminis]
MNILEEIQRSTPQLPDEYKYESEEKLMARIQEVKDKLGSDLFIPGHHYQKEEVIQFADARGDSLQLAQLSANTSARYIVFCGVHFMAETADILSTEDQKVYLPDLRAGCSMADMANIKQTERAWAALTEMFGETILPMTYVNSTAAIKAFVGERDGSTVTSSNAKKVMQWAFQQKERLLFLPDQHLGRNTAVELGVPLNEMAVWDPILEKLDYEGDLESIKVILWKGHCSVHENFTEQNIEQVRQQHPNMNILVHPECKREVVEKSDLSGSTKYIIEKIDQAPENSEWAIGTEMNLVKRLIKENPDKKIISLNPHMCPCLTMNRIDLPHLAWSLESLLTDQPVHEIKVDEKVTTYAARALDKMLDL